MSVATTTVNYTDNFSGTSLAALLAIDPAELTAAQATSIVTKLTDGAYVRRKQFYDGDHWQNGEGLAGLIPSATHPAYLTVRTRLEKAFVSQNVIREVVKRHQAGVCGHIPEYGLATVVVEENDDDDEEARKALRQDEEDRLEAYMEPVRTWWRDCGIHEIVMSAVRDALFSKRSVLRLRVAQTVTRENDEGDQEQGVEVEIGSLEAALKLIRLEYIGQNKAVVWEDGPTLEPRGIFLYQYQGKQAAELHYIDDTGRLVIRQIQADNVASAPLALDGQIMLFQLVLEALISDQVEQLQRLLNKTLTMLSTNLDWSAFIERLLLNAQPEGKETVDSQGNKVFTPSPPKVGPGITAYISGLPKFSPTGELVGHETPEVVFREPINVDTFTDSKKEAYENILREVQQLHVLITGDATTSGESRRQAMADFLISLLITKPAVDRMGRWLLETVLALASTLSGQEMPKSRAVFACRVDPGPIPASQMDIILKMVEARLVSRETAMGDFGIEDVAAELEQITAELGVDLEHAARQAEIYTTHRLGGTPVRLSATFAGYDEDTIETLVSAEFSDPDDDGNSD